MDDYRARMLLAGLRVFGPAESALHNLVVSAAAPTPSQAAM